MNVIPRHLKRGIIELRHPRYREPNLGHYIRYDNNGELHLFFDAQKQAEFDKKQSQSYMKKLQEKIKEMRK